MEACLLLLLPLLPMIAGGGILLLAAAHDLRRFEIPDRLSILLALLAFVHMALLPDFSWLRDMPLHLLSGLLVFALGVGLFAMGAMGGGDVKLMAALGLWTALPALPPLLTLVLLSGGVLALLLLVARRLAPHMYPAGIELPRLFSRQAPLPYAVAIAAGGFWWAATLAG